MSVFPFVNKIKKKINYKKELELKKKIVYDFDKINNYFYSFSQENLNFINNNENDITYNNENDITHNNETDMNFSNDSTPFSSPNDKLELNNNVQNNEINNKNLNINLSKYKDFGENENDLPNNRNDNNSSANAKTNKGTKNVLDMEDGNGNNGSANTEPNTNTKNKVQPTPPIENKVESTKNETSKENDISKILKDPSELKGNFTENNSTDNILPKNDKLFTREQNLQVYQKLNNNSDNNAGNTNIDLIQPIGNQNNAVNVHINNKTFTNKSDKKEKNEKGQTPMNLDPKHPINPSSNKDTAQSSNTNSNNKNDKKNSNNNNPEKSNFNNLSSMNNDSNTSSSNNQYENKFDKTCEQLINQKKNGNTTDTEAKTKFNKTSEANKNNHPVNVGEKPTFPSNTALPNRSTSRNPINQIRRSHDGLS